jgi:hypothetical protein
MKSGTWVQIAAVALAIGITGTAVAADNSPMRAIDATTSPLGKTPETAGVGSNDQSPNQNFDVWMNKRASMNNNRITRAEFMAQMSDRWDMMDAQHHGYLTPDQTRGIYMPGGSERMR